MRWLRGGKLPSSVVSLLAWLGPLGLLVALGGCAASSAEQAAALQAAGRVELEGDGLPAQAAPPSGLSRVADDPREPFSRNYGAWALPGQPGPRARLSPTEADALIARAIVAHEMRRP